MFQSYIVWSLAAVLVFAMAIQEDPKHDDANRKGVRACFGSGLGFRGQGLLRLKGFTKRRVHMQMLPVLAGESRLGLALRSLSRVAQQICGMTAYREGTQWVLLAVGPCKEAFALLPKMPLIRNTQLPARGDEGQVRAGTVKCWCFAFPILKRLAWPGVAPRLRHHGHRFESRSERMGS